jgi:hypothetical protein
MGLFHLFRFYREATTYTSPDQPALEQAGEARERHAAYHRRIVLVSGLFGALGVVFGLALSFVATGDTKSGKDVKQGLLAPFLFGAAGMLLGVAIACLFAPREFLAGPVGQKWMKLIGTKSIMLARIVCLLLGLVVMIPMVAIGLLIAFAK